MPTQLHLTPHFLAHIALHLLLPGLIAILFFRQRWRQAWLIMVLTMVVDFDHLLASPIYDPNRCSIAYHPLHSYLAILGYCLLAAISKVRPVGVGLLLHMAVDMGDCLWLGSNF